MKKDNEVLFRDYPIPKAVATLAIPTVAACLVMVLYNLADTFFVSKLNSSIETSAVTLAAPILLAFNAVTNLFGTGCSSVMSRALGAHDYNKFKKTAVFGLYCCVLAGLCFSLSATIFKKPLLNLLGADVLNYDVTAKYMFWTVTLGAIPSMVNVVMANLVRSEGNALHASIGTMSGCVLNMLLDPMFILPFGLNMGAAGAGLATFISNCVACAYFFVFLFIKRNETQISLNPKLLFIESRVSAPVFSVGIPASIQNILNVIGMTILNNVMAVYSIEAVSAMGITHKIAMVPMYVSMGITQGILPLIGYNYAAKNNQRIKETIKFTAVVAGGFMVLATGLFFVFSNNIISMFMKDAMIVSYGGSFLKGASLALPFLFVDFLAVGIFQACGDGRSSLIFAILRKVVLEIPAIYILDKIIPMYGVAYAQLVAELMLAIAAVIILKKKFKDVN